VTSVLVKARPCPHCDRPMISPRRVQCGAPECERLARNVRMAAYMAGRREADPMYGRRLVERECSGCPAVITPRAGALSQWCKRCQTSAAALVAAALYRLTDAERAERRHARRARRRAWLKAALIEPVYRLRIFERDGWTCLLCREPLARAEVVPHPLAPTIDHVIPLARGGAHAPWNVQAAHFLCNSLKGDRIEVTA
jgi:5-methylcytosine-specific restriction endonuclease McrA